MVNIAYLKYCIKCNVINNNDNNNHDNNSFAFGFLFFLCNFAMYDDVMMW